MMAFPDCGADESDSSQEMDSSDDKRIQYLERPLGSEPFYVLAKLYRDGDRVGGTELYKIAPGRTQK
jgi:hypothetical protein